MKKFSVILNSYNTNQAQAHQTMACLAAIRKFTDEPYEIIVIDNEKQWDIRDEYGVLQPYTYMNYNPKLTVYKAYNVGAKLATTDIFMFIQSDVFVHERTLNKLAAYLDEFDIAFPQQVPISRADVQEIYKLKDGEKAHIGQRDAGLIAMTREAFEKCGGWDERFRNMLGEAAFFQRWDNNGLSWIDTTNALVTHIMAGNNLQKTDDLYEEEMSYDAKLLKEEYGI